jgi:transposase InsO family protein
MHIRHRVQPEASGLEEEKRGAIDSSLQESDRGGEYFSNEFDLFCAEHGIIYERTPPYLLQSNGVVERKNRTLINLVNSILDTAELSKTW